MNVANDYFLRYRYKKRLKGIILKTLRSVKQAKT